MSCLCILEINPLLVALFANIFLHSVGYLFVLFTVSFAGQKLLRLIRSHLFGLFSLLKKDLAVVYVSLLLMFFSKSL